jgi:aminopeptidase N
VQGPQVRTATIRRALQLIPTRGADSRKPEDDAVIRAKSLLFFYGLQDRYGQDLCNKALSHMLYARRGGGFDLADLIAAFEEEVHQNVAEFVRQWMKHPGVPKEFRTRYENAAAAAANNSNAVIPKETTP